MYISGTISSCHWLRSATTHTNRRLLTPNRRIILIFTILALVVFGWHIHGWLLVVFYGDDFGGWARELRQPFNFTLAHFKSPSIVIKGDILQVGNQWSPGRLFAVTVHLVRSWRLPAPKHLLETILALFLDINLISHDFYFVFESLVLVAFVRHEGDRFVEGLQRLTTLLPHFFRFPRFWGHYAWWFSLGGLLPRYRLLIPQRALACKANLTEPLIIVLISERWVRLRGQRLRQMLLLLNRDYLVHTGKSVFLWRCELEARLILTS